MKGDFAVHLDGKAPVYYDCVYTKSNSAHLGTVPPAGAGYRCSPCPGGGGGGGRGDDTVCKEDTYHVSFFFFFFFFFGGGGGCLFCYNVIKVGQK